MVERRTFREGQARDPRVLMTQEAYDFLQEQLKAAKRAERIATEDWRNNIRVSDDYKEHGNATQLNQAMRVATSNLARIQSAIGAAEIIAPRQETDLVGLGNTLELQFDGADGKPEIVIQHLLGPTDLSVRQMGTVISYFSPGAQALIGRKAGETVSFRLDPKADSVSKTIKILQILPGQFERPREAQK